MADWNNPGLATAYADFLSQMKDRDVDAAQLAASPTNPPVGYIRYDTSTNRFERWTGAVWTTLLLSLSGGGTGASSAAAARTALGLGDMALQTSSAVSITGGTIQGILQVKGGNMTFDGDGTRDIGVNATRANRIYIRNALVIPAGTDKYATS